MMNFFKHQVILAQPMAAVQDNAYAQKNIEKEHELELAVSGWVKSILAIGTFATTNTA